MSGRCSTARESWATAITGQLQLAGEALEPAAELRHVLDAAAGWLLGAHQLQVVDHDQPQLVVADGDLPGLGAELEQRQVAVVEEVQRHAGGVGAGPEQVWPVVGLDAAEVQSLGVDAGFGGQVALGGFGVAHLQ